jgi:hypothetical protein
VSRKKKDAQAEAAPLVAYKAFDKDLKCRDFQFEVGKTYEHDGKVEACKSGFHACLRPLDVLGYYPPTSRFAVVELSGEVSTHDEDSKIAAAKLTVKAEVGLSEIIARTVDWDIAQCKPTEGSSNSGIRGTASNSGDGGAASNSGYGGAASNSGIRGAASHSGYGGAASNSGYGGTASNSGYGGAASNSGYGGAASNSGDGGVAASYAYDGKVMGSDGSALFLVERDDEHKIIAVWSGIAGRDGVRANIWYSLKGGVLTEVK